MCMHDIHRQLQTFDMFFLHCIFSVYHIMGLTTSLGFQNYASKHLGQHSQCRSTNVSYVDFTATEAASNHDWRLPLYSTSQLPSRTCNLTGLEWKWYSDINAVSGHWGKMIDQRLWQSSVLRFSLEPFCKDRNLTCITFLGLDVPMSDSTCDFILY